MLNLLRSSANTLVAAAQDVADELNKHSQQENSKLEGEAICLGSEGRLVLCGFPDRKLAGEIYREDRSLRPFSSPFMLKKFLLSTFPDVSTEFVVWNLSGKQYAYEELDGKIVEYDFPSRPILPFSVLVEVSTAIQSFLNAEKTNVTVIHDISGRRAAVVAACVMEMMEYYAPRTSLRAVATEMGKCGNALVASQVRYYEYFCASRNKESFDPSRKLLLQRVIVNGIPDFSSDNKLAPTRDLALCRPYMKIVDQKGNEIGLSSPNPKQILGEDASFSLTPTQSVTVSGDILIRFFHKRDMPQSDLAIFAVCFNVGFVNDVVLRFSLNDIDGTLKNPRFPKDIFVDVIFSDCIDDKEKVLENDTKNVNNDDSSTQIETQTADNKPSEKVSAGAQKTETNEGPQTSEVTKGPLQQQVSSTDNVLKEIEAALGDDDFAIDDFELSESEE